MEDLRYYLEMAVHNGCSDLFIVPGRELCMKKDGVIHPATQEILTPESASRLVMEIYYISGRDSQSYLLTGDDDFGLTLEGLSRFRVNAYRQQGSLAAVIRMVYTGVPSWKELGVPREVMKCANYKRGMVLVTGPAGSGKSTTLTCIINAINQTRAAHIITIEDPIEYIYKDVKSVISQREVGIDTEEYVKALRASLRQAPDVILLGEMRDTETISTAVTAAETGHIVFSTLHTTGAANSINRIIDSFPPTQQQQIRIQLAQNLSTVISQQLVPGIKGKLIAAFEIMHLNSAICSCIRENKIHQIDATIAVSQKEGMISMDDYLAELYKARRISKEVAMRSAISVDDLRRRIGDL